MKTLISGLIITLWFFTSSIEGARQNKSNSYETNPPRLIIGIIVDQMRYDYLYRYAENYGNGGFKRLLAEGFNCRNTHFNYIPTYTGPGHASIYTGTSPQYHGIVGNVWYVREEKTRTYVTRDNNVKTVGSNSVEGKMSPVNLQASTITDELRLYNNLKSKVISISLKDRGAILPGGYLSNGTYWFDKSKGLWITSTFYKTSLPEWVNDFNKNNNADSYLNKKWDLLLAPGKYKYAIDKNTNVIHSIAENTSRFPHDIPKRRQQAGPGILCSTPFGNTNTLDFALKSIEAENLGKDAYPDFLAISFSATDYIGHFYGVPSVEVEDTYLRLDLEIERLLNYLDKNFGKDSVLLFLTSDHGAAYSPKYLNSLNLPGGIIPSEGIITDLNKILASKYGLDNLILDVVNFQLYLNHKVIKSREIEMAIERDCYEYLQGVEGIFKVIVRKDLGHMMLEDATLGYLKQGYNTSRSGDILVIPKPGWIEGEDYRNGGTSHGSYYPYDTHVPLLWYGNNIKAGSSNARVSITDIAPTLADMLNISAPNATNGNIIYGLPNER